jgi:HSP20 family molecular chaperone IbpA
MSEESERFLRDLVDGAERLTAHEMVESFEVALAAISAGHGTVAWRDGEPIGGSIWQPKVRWHVDTRTAHVFVDVAGIEKDCVSIEARGRGLNLTFRRVKEKVLSEGQFHTHEEVSQRSVDLGVEIDVTAVRASVDGGIMHIRCPRDREGLKVVDITWDE